MFLFFYFSRGCYNDKVKGKFRFNTRVFPKWNVDRIQDEVIIEDGEFLFSMNFSSYAFCTLMESMHKIMLSGSDINMDHIVDYC